MSSYVVAIPSYKRPELISSKTLLTLETGKVPSQNIYIFVASSEEAKEYKTKVPKHLYHKVVVGKLGITPQRIFISKYFPENTHIVSMDDDISSVHQLHGAALSQLQNLHTFFIKAFETCKQHNLYIWGIYPVLNPFYMKPTTSTTGLKFILGTMYGYINRPKSKDVLPSLPEKEDFEMSILYYLKDGAVVRFNNIGVKTKFHNRMGGLGALSKERLYANEQAARELERRYPHLGYVWHRKTTGVAEFRFNRIKC